MIALPAFVVISQHAFPTHNVGETVFERMLRRGDRFRDSPYGDLCKCVGSKDNTTANERNSLHVGDYDNTKEPLSMSPTIFISPVRSNVGAVQHATSAAKRQPAAARPRRATG